MKKDRSIIIKRADKGGKIVLLDRSDYIDKAKILLDDRNTYICLTSNPLQRHKKDVRDVLRANIGDVALHDSLLPTNPDIGYFYGLPKIHKEGVPLRPIISSHGTALKPLSIWLAKILSHFMGSVSECHLKYSMDFVERTRGIDMSGKKMISFDVTTYLEVFLAEKPLPIELDKLIILLRFCVSNNYFVFEGKFYCQVFGVGMGSSLSAVFACLYMEFYETLLVPTIRRFEPGHWLSLRY